MAKESEENAGSASAATRENSPSSSSSKRAASARSLLLSFSIVTVAIAALLYRAEDFDPAPLPEHGLSWRTVVVPVTYHRIAEETERLGEGLLPGPEDLAYDAGEGVIYTGCGDGWMKRVNVAGDDGSSVTIRDWAHVGGRPLGVALGPDGQLIVAESGKGLLKVTREGEVHLLSSEAEQVKFQLTDGVAVAKDGIIYFTDASYKYSFKDHMLDILEGRPHGRLLSFHPQSNLTTVLLHDLYFANGVSLSPQEDFLVFCETPLRRCMKYLLQGEEKGSVVRFIDNLPGYPDNIRYDGEGHFWIGLSGGSTLFWKTMMGYPVVRKAAVMLSGLVGLHHTIKESGVLSVDLEGKAVALYSDPRLALVTGGVKIGNHLYYGSLSQSYIGRLDLAKYVVRDT